MPPPKKPKNGPTRAELFLSSEEMVENNELPATPDSLSPVHSPEGAATVHCALPDRGATRSPPLELREPKTNDGRELETLSVRHGSLEAAISQYRSCVENNDQPLPLRCRTIPLSSGVRRVGLETTGDVTWRSPHLLTSVSPLNLSYSRHSVVKRLQRLSTSPPQTCQLTTCTALPPGECLGPVAPSVDGRVASSFLRETHAVDSQGQKVDSASSPTPSPLAVNPDDHGGGTPDNHSPLSGHAQSAQSPNDQPTSTVDFSSSGRTSPVGRGQNKTSKAATGKQCQICSDIASGFHYGVWSCEGCKAFFKRSLIPRPGQPDYICPATNNCTIDKNRRKSCQACRLQKCYREGMHRTERKEKGVRQVRVAQKRRSTEEHEVATPQTTPPPKIKQIKTESRPNAPAERSTCSNMLSSLLGAEMPCDPPNTTHIQPVHPLVQVLQTIEPPRRVTWHDRNGPQTQLSLMNSLLRLANDEIVDIINWAKSIPGYTDLNMQERIRLLEASWMEILIAGLLWRSMPYPDVLFFSQDFRWDRETCEAANMSVLGDKMMKLTNRFAQLAVSQEEFVLLRAMILLNADVVDSAQSTHLQQQLEEALHYTIVKRLNKNVGQMSQLLLLLPHIRQASINSVNHIMDLCNKELVSIDMLDLLKEMLQAASMPRSPNHVIPNSP